MRCSLALNITEIRSRAKNSKMRLTKKKVHGHHSKDIRFFSHRRGKKMQNCAKEKFCDGFDQQMVPGGKDFLSVFKHLL